MNRAGRKHFLGSVGLCLACSVAAGQNTGWTVYNGGPDGDHYSPLTQINRGNVNGLKVAWSFDTGEKGVLEDNPLIVGRVLYAYTQSQKVIALDAATAWSGLLDRRQAAADFRSSVALSLLPGRRYRAAGCVVWRGRPGGSAQGPGQGI